MIDRREFTIAVALCASGAGLVLLAAGQPWVRVLVRLPHPLQDTTHALEGGQLAPLASALGLAGLAGLAGLFATRGYPRLVVGVLLAVIGGAVLYASMRSRSGAAVHQALVTEAVLVRDGPTSMTWTPWWGVSLLGGALLVLGGLLTAMRGRGWPGLSRKYAAPGGHQGTNSARTADDSTATADMWDTLDEGNDPTTS